MKSKTQIFGGKILAVVSLMAGASLFNTANAEITADEVYLVGPGRTTQLMEHENAMFGKLLIQPPPDKEVGVMFMQTKGSYPFVPFICSPAFWHVSSKSYSCSKESQLTPTLQLRETLTIGRISSNFCKNKREDHNPPPHHAPNPNNRILAPGECPAGAANCSCYEISHECRVDPSHSYGACPNPLPTPTAIPLRADNPGKFFPRSSSHGGAPPTRGSGSGGSN